MTIDRELVTRKLTLILADLRTVDELAHKAREDFLLTEVTGGHEPPSGRPRSNRDAD